MVESSSDQAIGSVGPTSSGFVGRQREMYELAEALKGALSGRGQIVMLVGEPGIGKTRTAKELATHAQRLGAQVLWGWCYEEEGAPPYWPWVNPIRAYVQERDAEELLSEMGASAADIAEIIPDLRSKLPDLAMPPLLDSPEAARFRLFDSVSSFLINIAQTQPLVIVLDDLHWGDRPSLLLLQFLARQLEASRIMVVGCYRDVEISRHHPLSDTMAQLSREPVFRRQLLRGISEEDTAHFIEQAAGVIPSTEVTETVYALTEGNPFFLTEVVRLLSERAELWKEDTGIAQAITVPAGIREAVGQRLNRRSEGCNRLLTTASVVGRQFSLDLIARLLEDTSKDSLLNALEEALASGMIEALPASAGRYQFTHALIQNTLFGELSVTRRAGLHARIGEALEELHAANPDAEASTLAYHFAEAMPMVAPEKLVRYSLLAGEQALAVYAWEEALVHFERGLAAKEGQPMDAETAALLFGLGRAQTATVERVQEVKSEATLSRAFDYYAEAGDVERAVAVAGQVIRAELGGDIISKALAMVPADSHQAGLLLPHYIQFLGRAPGGWDYNGAQEACSQALAIARREGDTALEIRTLVQAACLDEFHGRFKESLERNLRAIELVQHTDQPGEEAHAHYDLAHALYALGDLEEAAHHAGRMLGPAERSGIRRWYAGALQFNQNVSSAKGDWRAARDFSDRGLDVSPMDPPTLASRAELEYQTGNFSQGEAYLERLLATVQQGPPGSLVIKRWVMVIPAIARITGVMDRLDVAEETAKTILSSSSAPRLTVQPFRIGLALIAVQKREVEAVAEQYSALKPTGGTMSQRGVFLCIDRVLGLLATAMGHLELAAGHFEDALAVCRNGFLPELAWTCHDYADAILQRDNHGDREKAMSLLSESLSICRESGMPSLMERSAALLEKDGSQTGEAPAYTDGLTQRELEVLCLISSGKTNRQIAEELFISLHTVGHHVRNILSKTGTANRTEVATYAVQRRLAQ